MALVMVIQVGSRPKMVDTATVQALRDSLELGLNHKVLVNGQAATPETILADGDKVTVAEQQKGA